MKAKGGFVSKPTLVLVSAVLCSTLPAHAQQKPVTLPDRPGKEDVTPDGNPVMANSTVNFVGMVEVK